MSWMSPRANALLDAARGGMSLDPDRAARMRARLLAATGAGAGVAVATIAATKAGAGAAATAATVSATVPAPAAATVSAAATVPATATGAATGAAVATKVSMGIGAKLALILVGAAAVATGTHMVDRMILRAPAPVIVLNPTLVMPAAPPRTVLVPVPTPTLVPAPDPRLSISLAADDTSVRSAPLPGLAAITPPHHPTDDAPAPARVQSADDLALIAEPPPPLPDDRVVTTAADALARELSQVRGAQAALRDGDGDTALVALDAHDRDFPRGQLAEEAGVLRIEALCRVGRPIDAATARAAFVARWPRSAQRARAEHACGGAEAP